VSLHATPRFLRSDNGPEFVATAILRYLQAAQIETAFMDPGKLWHNAPTNPSTASSAISTCHCSDFGIGPTRKSVRDMALDANEEPRTSPIGAVRHSEESRQVAQFRIRRET